MTQPLRVLVSCRTDTVGGQRSDEPNDAAIEFAAWLARTTDTRLRGITTFVRPWPSTSISKLGGKYRKWFDREAKIYEDRTRKSFKSAGIDEKDWDKTVSVFADGPSESVLLTHAAEKFDADLILLGSEASASKGRILAGTTADALLHSSPVPLGLAPRAPKLSKKGVTRVNYGFVTEEKEDRGLLYAAKLASQWKAPLRILAFSPAGIADSPVSDKLDVASALSTEWREHTLAVLDRARDTVADACPDLTVTGEIGSGWGWGGAIDALKWKKGDLLCLGSHPMGPLERVFVGSETMEIIRNISVPTIIHPGR